jgi:uncharacterized protein (TIGR02145 family)
MNKILLILLSLILTTNAANAQAPDEIAYQVIVHGAANTLVKNKQVKIKISILEESLFGTAVFIETHLVTTNANALASIVIGKGTAVLGLLKNVNWSTGVYFLKTEIDPNAGNNFTESLVSQFLSVPYSLYTKSADYNKVLHQPDLSGLAARSQFDDLLEQAKILAADTANTIADIDGYRYKMVTIGTRVWLDANLRTTRLNDGTPIANLKDSAAWFSTNNAAYSWPYNDENFGRSSYGALYNFPAVKSGKLCPVGFHVPDSTDVTSLNTLPGGSSVFKSLMDASGQYWATTAAIGVKDSLHFTALPPIFRIQTLPDPSFFYDVSNIGFFVDNHNNTAMYFRQGSGKMVLVQGTGVGSFLSNSGLSVRCVKD